MPIDRGRIPPRHVSPDPLEAIKGVDLVTGWDFGLQPTVVIGQISPLGQPRILDEPGEISLEDYGRSIRVPLAALAFDHVADALRWAHVNICPTDDEYDDEDIDEDDDRWDIPEDGLGEYKEEVYRGSLADSILDVLHIENNELMSCSAVARWDSHDDAALVSYRFRLNGANYEGVVAASKIEVQAQRRHTVEVISEKISFEITQKIMAALTRASSALRP